MGSLGYDGVVGDGIRATKIDLTPNLFKGIRSQPTTLSLTLTGKIRHAAMSHLTGLCGGLYMNRVPSRCYRDTPPSRRHGTVAAQVMTPYEAQVRGIQLQLPTCVY